MGTTTFNYSGMLTTYVIPRTGTYFISAYGAQGGPREYGYGGTQGGGGGGEVGGDFVLTQGETLVVAVGGGGGSGQSIPVLSGSGGGGGGGSFVSVVSDGVSTLLEVAGGGAGNLGGAGGESLGGSGLGGATLDGAGGGGGINGAGQSSTAPPTIYDQSGSAAGGGGDIAQGLGGGAGGTFMLSGFDISDNGGAGGFGGGGGGAAGEIGGGGGGYTGGEGGAGGTSYIAADAIDPFSAAGVNAATSGLYMLGLNGEVIVTDPACFATGTRLATPTGSVAVEALRPGDRVISLRRGIAVPVRAVHRRVIDCARQPVPARVWPVRVRAGAFGPGRPARDLRLSPEHAVYVDGVLIPVRVLVDGVSIVSEACARVTYWHVELDCHDVVAAEGLPVESYLATAGRARAPRVWEADGCAPLHVTGAIVGATRARLAANRLARAA